MRIGIMQGRLVPPEDGRFQSFPVAGWAQEFARAREVGLEAIEWIYDAYGEGKNPIETDEGVDRVRQLGEENGVAVASLCADWFLDNPLLRVDEATVRYRMERLQWLLGRCSAAGIERVVLPFVDASQISSGGEAEVVIGLIERAMPWVEEFGIELHLETSLGPADFAGLLGRLDHPLIRANYDSGNSASLGYLLDEEFAAYGPRVGSVHIKDRVLGGGTVPLGHGNADLPRLFANLRAVGYSGDCVLQVARGAEGDEVAWAKANAAIVRSHNE